MSSLYTRNESERLCSTHLIGPDTHNMRQQVDVRLNRA